MLTLQTLGIFLILGTIGSLLLLKDGYVKHAKYMFFNLTITPIGLILFMILMIGCVPMR